MPARDPARLAALRRLMLPLARSTDSLARLARLAARFLDAPSATVALVDAYREVFPGCHPLAAPADLAGPGPLSRALCRHVTDTGHRLVVDDTHAHPLCAALPGAPRADASAFLGVPLATEDGTVFGCFFVMDPRPRRWTPEQVEILQDLAASVMTEVELRLDQVERARTEAALRASEQRLRTQVELSTDGILLLDGRGAILDCNSAALALFGYGREELLGRSMAELNPPERLPLLSRTFDEAVERRALEWTHRRRDGTFFPSELTTRLYEAEGERRVVVYVRDLTERTRTERERAAAQAHYGRLVATIPMGVYVLDARACFVELNGAAECILERDVSALLGRPFTDVLDPAAGAAAMELFGEVLAGWRDDVESDVLIRRPSGDTRLLSVTATAIHQEGRIVGLHGIARDITEQRGAERALRESEAKFRQIAENVREVFWIFSPDFSRTVYISPAFERIWMRPLEEVYGDARALLATVLPADRPALRGALAQVREDVVVGVEFRVVRPDGSLRWVFARGFPVRDARGTVYRVVGTAADVTEHKSAEEALRQAHDRLEDQVRERTAELAQSEQLFRSLIENSGEMVTVADGNGVVRFASPAVERLTGYRPDELVGRRFAPFVHPDDVGGMGRSWDENLRSPGRPVAYELRFRHRDGTWRVMEGIATNLLDDPAVRGMVANTRDVTEAREREEMLRQAQRMEAVGRLSGGIAHDFNNLIMAIRGNVALLLRRAGLDEALGRDLREIEDAAERAARLTQQLLAFSRRQILQPSVLDLNAVVRELQQMLRRLIGENVEIVSRLGEGVGPVLADRGQLEQVLVNLAVNARDAMPRGGRLTIETGGGVVGAVDGPPAGLLGAGREVAWVRVADTGCGMRPEVVDKIFEPFFTTKEQGRGTGLGLATVYGIVRQSGGAIVVESTPGVGTTFHVSLPVARDAVVEPAPVPEPAPVGGGGEVVLLVEDERMVRRLVRRVLQDAGYQVMEAPDAAEALALCGRRPERIDLLVTDMVMPRMGGRELAEAVQAARPGIRVLYMSGYTDDQAFQAGRLKAGSTFIHKPIHPDALLRAVRELLDGEPAAPRPAAA